MVFSQHPEAPARCAGLTTAEVGRGPVPPPTLSQHGDGLPMLDGLHLPFGNFWGCFHERTEMWFAKNVVKHPETGPFTRKWTDPLLKIVISFLAKLICLPIFNFWLGHFLEKQPFFWTKISKKWHVKKKQTFSCLKNVTKLRRQIAYLRIFLELKAPPKSHHVTLLDLCSVKWQNMTAMACTCTDARCVTFLHPASDCISNTSL